ncbi:MAG: FAD-dependent oxidoreductase [Acidobacteriaceae bacterium]|nr:FAD-dependent oxidoreductase [Acidobacteriaceae bacterium]
MNSEGPVKRPAVAIVGGGVIGLSIAFYLSRQKTGLFTEVFEQGVAGGEASWAGAGMLAPGGELDEQGPLAALAIESRRMYSRFLRDLEDASQLAIDYQECGALEIAYSEDELRAIDRRAERQRELGIQSRRITRTQVATFWPRIRREGLVGGRFYPDDAIVNPRELTHALRCVCSNTKVTVHEHCRVNAMEVSDNGVVVESDRGNLNCEIAIVSAGAWSGEVKVTGVPALPLSEPVKGHLIGYDQPEQTCNTIVRHGPTYLLQRANGLLIAGSSLERVGFNRELNPTVEADLARRAGFLLPHLAETSPSESWMGFRPASDDLHIGMWHSPRLYLAYGHFRNGILLAPATAERIAAQLSANLQTL